MQEAADAIEVFRGGAPGGFCFARGAVEAAVVVGQEAAQDSVGILQIGGSSQAGVGRDVGDAELSESAAELGGLTLAGELFLNRPAIVVADEDAVAIAVKTERNTMTAQQAAQQAEIAASVFGGEEFGGQDLGG